MSFAGRRRVLAHIAAVIPLMLAGCSGENGAADIRVVNDGSEEYEVAVAVEDFEESVTLAPDERETFTDVLDHPESAEPATMDLEIEGVANSTDFVLSETLDELEVVIEGPDQATLNRISDS